MHTKVVNKTYTLIIEELIALTIDKYTDLQRIKKANGNVENKELNYQLKITIAKLSSLGISVEDITL